MPNHLRLVADEAAESTVGRTTVEVEIASAAAEQEFRRDENRHHLIWHVEGSVLANVAGRSWMLPSGSGIWVPAGAEYRIGGQANNKFGIAGIDRLACPDRWDHIAILRVDPVLNGLLIRLREGLPDVAHAHIEFVVFDLLHAMFADSPVELAMPEDERCRQVVEGLLEDPGAGWDLDDWAREVGTSARTLKRLFQAEAGPSFGQWRTHARMHGAVAGLAAGKPVAEVARLSGYSATSSFVRAFKQATGRAPGSHIAGTSVSSETVVNSETTVGAVSRAGNGWPPLDTDWPRLFGVEEQASLTVAESAALEEGLLMLEHSKPLAIATLVAAAMALLATACGSSDSSSAASED